MSQIKASDVMQLREITNIGMMKCKEALVEANGDQKEALRILKEKGLATAAKRADRSTNEGIIFIQSDCKNGYMLSLCCETDFVAKGEVFSQLVKTISKEYTSKGTDYIESKELKEKLIEATSKSGEKIEIKEHCHICAAENGYISHYIHSNQKIGVLVELETQSKDNEKVESLAKDIAMQIAAMNPIAIRPEEIEKNVIDEQRLIFKQQMSDTNKPENILDKIIEGKLNKYFSEICLLDMNFVKDNSIKIKELIAKIQKSIGSTITIKQFKRFQIG